MQKYFFDEVPIGVIEAYYDLVKDSPIVIDYWFAVMRGAEFAIDSSIYTETLIPAIAQLLATVGGNSTGDMTFEDTCDYEWWKIT